ncbi:MAG: hypothetical protein K0S76_1336 [Herbinix sp.]|jgi:serine protease Do|nr:hypothetical protein [Herbinix sp.]
MNSENNKEYNNNYSGELNDANQPSNNSNPIADQDQYMSPATNSNTNLIQTNNGYTNTNSYPSNGNYSYYTNNYPTYQNMDQENNNQNIPDPDSSVADTKNGKGKTKKSGFKNFLATTAAAILFGLVAGGVFQGYNALVTPKSEKNNEAEVNIEIDTTEVTDKTSDDTGIVPTSNIPDGIITDVSDVVEKVMPSIVAINSIGTSVNYDFFGRQYDEPVAGSGSGIIIGQNETELLIVTNNHVIQGATKVEIDFIDETTAKATVKGADSSADLAVLSVSMKELSKDTASKIRVAALGNSDEVKAGEMVIAIGNALGYGQSVTVGYISAVNREVTIDNQTLTLLQTDAAINPGNSGGALMNTNGEVIGINTLKSVSTSQVEVEGMGYAIPISSAIPMMNELMNREEIATSEQGFLGIYLDSAQNVTEIYAQRFNMPVGVYINKVVENSPAAAAGIKQGYIITKLNEKQIKTVDELVEALSYHRAGEAITLTVSALENGDYVEKDLSITLGEK